jgi:hypothetical protein
MALNRDKPHTIFWQPKTVYNQTKNRIQFAHIFCTTDVVSLIFVHNFMGSLEIALLNQYLGCWHGDC